MPPTELMSFRDTTIDTPIAIASTLGGVELSVRDVQKWIHPSAPPAEAMKFLIVCQQARVNPFMGEAHLVNHGDRWTTIIDKSGYLRRAQDHPMYAGHQAGIIARPWDSNRKVFSGQPVEVQGSFLPPDHLVIGGWAKVFRADREVPTYASVSMQEYNRNQGTWKSIPCTMIRKVALVQALRESGLITSGWYDPAEVQDEPIGPGYTAVRKPVMPAGEVIQKRPAIELEYQPVEDASCPPDMLVRIRELMDQLGIKDDDYIWRDALAKRGVEHVAQLSATEARGLLTKLEFHASSTGDVFDGVAGGDAGDSAGPAAVTAETAEPVVIPAEDFELADAPRTPARGAAVDPSEEAAGTDTGSAVESDAHLSMSNSN